MNKNAVADLDLDARYLQGFVAGLDEPLLLQIFEELRQTIDLLQSDNTDEFYSIDTRMKKYSNVNPLTGPVLLEKYVFYLLPHAYILLLCLIRVLMGFHGID